MSSEEPPRMLGGLLALLGLALAGGGLHMNLNLGGGGTYFLVVGILVLVSGVLLYQGKSAALGAFGVALATVWIWSLKDEGANFSALLPRVALPTLFGLYIFSGKIRSRLK